MKKGVLALVAIVAIFLIWEVLDFIVNVAFLGEVLRATAKFWRPPHEMKLGLLYFAHFVSAGVFVSIYAMLIAKKSMLTALQYGLLFGLGTGVSGGYGVYAVMPVPYKMALTFFLSTTAKTILGGFVLGSVIKR